VKPFFVYMLRCADGSIYAGHTDDLPRQLAQHEAGQVVGCTAANRPLSLLWSQQVATQDEALDAEARIRGWGLAEKEALIRGDGSAVQRLVKKRQTGAPAEPVADPLVQPVLAGQRRAMAKAITLLESTRADHRAQIGRAHV
jgi:predicted GIY-YIG superfamily endonuclease